MIVFLVCVCECVLLFYYVLVCDVCAVGLFLCVVVLFWCCGCGLCVFAVLRVGQFACLIVVQLFLCRLFLCVVLCCVCWSVLVCVCCVCIAVVVCCFGVYGGVGLFASVCLASVALCCGYV